LPIELREPKKTKRPISVGKVVIKKKKKPTRAGVPIQGR